MRQHVTGEKAMFRPTDSYMKRVKHFPLRPLRTEAEYTAAVEILGKLAMKEELDEGTKDYAAALSRFVGDYEEKRFDVKAAKMTPLEVIKFLMEENDMTTTDLGYVLGSRGIASEVLNGKRGLSKMLIRRLAERFGVAQSAFLDHT